MAGKNNYWWAVGYGAFLIAVVQDLRRGKQAGPGITSLSGSGRGALASMNKALPTDTLPGEDLRGERALARADETLLTKEERHKVRNIDERVSYIRKRINEDSLHPDVVSAARVLVSKKCGTRNGVRWCLTPKDYGQEIRAIYEAVQNAKSKIAMRYVRDHAKVDQFTAANKLIRLRAGDCDDGTVLLGSLLMAIGYPIKMRVIQDVNASSWSHIYPLVGVNPGAPSTWIPLDWSVYPFRPPGWQAPGADEVARTGKPSGIVVRVRDYEV